MARRLFNGRPFSENGWPYVDQGSCTWVTVPGTNVTLQIQNGPPLTIMRAFAADYNAYVERLRDPDSACWTEGNSVATSNHPGGTAMDLNWDGPDGRTFRFGISKQRAYPGDEARNVDELLGFYEDIIFCGGFWDIRDWMHFQMAGGTYDTARDQPHPKCQDFINRKIRADGFSTFRRGNAPPPPAGLTRDSLARAMGGSVTLTRYEQLLQPARVALIQSGCGGNLNRLAMWLAQIGHESVGLKYFEEIASGAAYEGRADLGNTQPGDGVRFKGRGPIQITGRHNYTALSQWAFSKGLVPTPAFFVDKPALLASDQYGFLGAVWYWTVARPQINALCDAGDLEGVTRAINGGLNGLSDRRDRWNRCRSMGLAALDVSASPPPEEGFLMALSDQEQRDLYNAIVGPRYSRSPLRSLGQGPVGNSMDLLNNTDGSVHVLIVKALAAIGHPDMLALLHEIAEADLAKYPDRARDKELAQAILAEIATPSTSAPAAASFPTPIVMQRAAVAPVVVDEPEVLPAAVERYTEPEPASNTPSDLLNTLDRLNAFDKEYRQKFDNLTKETEEPTS